MRRVHFVVPDIRSGTQQLNTELHHQASCLVGARPMKHIDRCFGGHSERETPGHIPNPEAKTLSADGTARGTLWESRTPPDLT
jgi:hypothetical protein